MNEGDPQMNHGRPFAIDLFCGLGGWTEGLLAEGYDVIGFDIEQHVYGEHRYPAQLVVQDVLTLHGSQFKTADLIVASPPCQEFSYMAMPWSRAKAKAAAIRADETGAEMERLTELFWACFRIQCEACKAAGRHIPMIVENVKGAQPWVGRARWSFGSFYLWGDVPALMPVVNTHQRKVKMASWRHPDDPRHVPGQGFNTIADRNTKNTDGSWFNVAHNTTSGKGRNPDGRKVPGFRFDGSGASFQTAIVDGLKSDGGSWFGDYGQIAEGVKQRGSGREWFAGDGKISRMTSSKSPARKFASAMIAKIPLQLARHIARTFYPRNQSEAAE